MSDVAKNLAASMMLVAVVGGLWPLSRPCRVRTPTRSAPRSAPTNIRLACLIVLRPRRSGGHGRARRGGSAQHGEAEAAAEGIGGRQPQALQ
jgi:hypothetical protein